MTDAQTTENPLEQGPKPPYPEQEQEPVGLESEMQPKPDYGEASYRGFGRLRGKAAIITGGGSGIGRAHPAIIAPQRGNPALPHPPAKREART